ASCRSRPGQAADDNDASAVSDGMRSGGGMRFSAALERMASRYPAVLFDAVTAHDPGRQLDAVKNVTIAEEFFQGHFPGAPLMPGVLMIESFAQVSAVLLADSATGAPPRSWQRGVSNAKFRRQVVPGDRLQLSVTLGRRRGRIAFANGVASVDGQVVAEADLVMV